jgi:hypothetical protein
LAAAVMSSSRVELGVVGVEVAVVAAGAVVAVGAVVTAGAVVVEVARGGEVPAGAEGAVPPGVAVDVGCSGRRGAPLG